ncbi:TIP-1 family-domain-containing protein [Auriculariales sp. MPI-PUGE-AT-0066]|nr:TIP-1 family-domain-containing protein [Auriculariales sp. MPI-PUGE-AT-0066]
MSTIISSQIHDFSQQPDTHAAVQRALALLDAQFPSVDDVGALERAAGDAQATHDQLQAKADASQAATDTLVNDTLVDTRARLQAAQELSLSRYALMDDLAGLKDELTSSLSDPDSQPTLLEELETLQRKLAELEHVRDYIRVVHHALGLCEKAETEMRESKVHLSKSHPAILQYKTLQAFVLDVQRACEAADDGSLAIVGFLQSVQRKTWSAIQDVLAVDLQKAAETLGWPMTVQEHRVAFEKAFRNLLHLQEMLHSETADSAKTVPLYALQALVHPVALRFKFHFDGQRLTNRPDKPELFFTNILNVSHQHRPFLEDYIQQLLDKSTYSKIDAWREFTRLLLPILTRKIRSTVPLLLPHPALLAHLVYQTIAFDESIREAGFSLKGTMRHWTTRTKARFDDEQYDEIDNSPDAWQIADEAGEEGTKSGVRSTNSARRMKSLIEQITERYQALPRLPHRVRFLLHIQLPLLDEYLQRISRSLDSFAQLASSLAAVVPGGLSGQVDYNAKKLTSGVEGSTRLVKAMLSARTIEAALKAWAEDAFFLDLWAEMGKQPALQALAESHPLLPNQVDVENSTVFDRMIEGYTELCTRAEDMLVRQVVRDIEDDLHAHLSSPWEEHQSSDPTTLPPGVTAPLAALASQLVFLRSTLPIVQAISLYRRIASSLADYIVQRGIVYRGRGRVSLATAARFAEEARLWVSTSQAALQREPLRRVEAPWAVLLEATILLTMEGDKWERAKRSVESDLTYGAAMHELGITQLPRLSAREIVRARVDFTR